MPKSQPQVILNERNMIKDYEMSKDEQIEMIKQDSKIHNLKQALATEEELPILTKKGYACTPSLAKLARYTSQ